MADPRSMQKMTEEQIRTAVISQAWETIRGFTPRHVKKEQ